MALGKRGKGRQQELFVAASEIRALGNPFYRALNRLLGEQGFDEFAEETCREFYSQKRGRPSIPPGVYFRMLLVGYLEGIGSERGIAWRCGDSISPGIRASGLAEESARNVQPGAGGSLSAGRGRDDAGGERGDALDRAARRRWTRSGWRRWRGRRGSRRRRGFALLTGQVSPLPSPRCDDTASDQLAERWMQNQTMTGVGDRGLRSYVSEPNLAAGSGSGTGTRRSRTPTAGGSAARESGYCASAGRRWSGDTGHMLLLPK